MENYYCYVLGKLYHHSIYMEEEIHYKWVVYFQEYKL